jgi:glycerophosphoryl diester phosphodiesterase
MLLRAVIFLLFTVVTSPALEIIAHRGFSARAPENTLAALKLGWKSKADACELDIHLTADNGIAVIHDRDTKRTTGQKLSVAKTKLADLMALDAGSWKDRSFSEERIPSLEQALAILPKAKQKLFIEIKCGPEIVPALQSQLEPIKKRAEQLAIITFKKESAAAAKKAMPWVQVYRLSGAKTSKKEPIDLTALIQEAKADQLDGLDLGLDWAWTPDLVAQIRAAGLKVYAYTINKSEDVRRLAQLGIDGITTDDPVMARGALALP